MKWLVYIACFRKGMKVPRPANVGMKMQAEGMIGEMRNRRRGRRASPRKEIPQIHKLAMPFILHVDHTPSALPSSDRLAIDHDVLLRPNDCERDHLPEPFVELNLSGVVLLRVERIQSDLVILQFRLDPRFEGIPLFEGKRITLRDHRYDVDNLGKLSEDSDVKRLEGMASRVDEVETAVDSSVRDESVSLGSQFFSEIARILILDVSHDGFPAPLVVNQITKARGINNVELQSDTVLDDCLRERER